MKKPPIKCMSASTDTQKLTEEHAGRLYDVFVHFMHAQFGGPEQQRTPTTDSAQRIASHMQDKDGEQLCNALCREYLSNTRIDLPNECKTANFGAPSDYTQQIYTILVPVLDWYQSEEEDARPPLEILQDIVDDLQSDRADLLALRAQIGKPPEGSHSDEQWPRSATWHEEWRAWSIEVERLKAVISSQNV